MGSETGIYGTDDLRNVGKEPDLLLFDFLSMGLENLTQREAPAGRGGLGVPEVSRTFGGTLGSQKPFVGFPFCGQVKVWDQSCWEELVSSFPFPDFSMNYHPQNASELLPVSPLQHFGSGLTEADVRCRNQSSPGEHSGFVGENRLS